MPQTKKDIKKLKQKQAVKAGTAQKLVNGKLAKEEKTKTCCVICKREFTVVGLNKQMHSHCETHKESYLQCFPGFQ